MDPNSNDDEFEQLNISDQEECTGFVFIRSNYASDRALGRLLNYIPSSTKSSVQEEKINEDCFISSKSSIIDKMLKNELEIEKEIEIDPRIISKESLANEFKKSQDHVTNFLAGLLCLRPNVLEDFCAIRLKDEMNQFHRIHPIDLRNRIFELLKIEMRTFCCEKLLQLRLSIPLMITDTQTGLGTLYLDSLSTVRYMDENGFDLTLIQEKIPVISFARIGKLNESKSKILNKILMDGNRQVFYNYDLKNGSCEKVAQEGMIDFSWEFEKPEVNRKRVSKKPTRLFLNLHGNSSHLLPLVKFVERISNKFVFFVQDLKSINFLEKCFEDSLSESKFVIVVYNKECKENHNLSGLGTFIFKGEMNEFELVEKIKESYEDLNFDEIIAMENFYRFVDERKIKTITLKEFFNESHELLKSLKNLIEDKDLNEDWRLFNRKEKEKYRFLPTREKCHAHIKEDIINSQKKFKEKILNKMSIMEKEMKYFAEKMLSAKSKEEFFHLITSFEKSALLFPGLSIDKVFRRLSQSCRMNISTDLFSRLASRMLRNGYPVELMDGDNSVIYIEWIHSIFTKLYRHRPRSKVAVISILGIQSSGKSTLLNAMFGLNFRTSPGRCTNGAHMQFIEVCEEDYNHFGYTHVLIIDVEGLSSIEKRSKNSDYNATHDNELATTIICMSDLCLINIMGENLCEIENVLKICILAMVRMQRVNLKCGLVFVHQNVTDPLAKKCNADTRETLYNELNCALEYALKEEESIFNDVKTPLNQLFNFNFDEDVFYFPHFVQGTPPRAYPSNSYADSVALLKSCILEKKLHKKGLSFPDLCTKIEDVWKAILNESFVFSFKNTLEVKVYHEIEKKYNDCVFKISQILKNVDHEEHTKIINERSDFTISIGEISKKINPQIKTIFESLTEFFVQEPYQIIKLEFKTKTENRLRGQLNEMLSQVSEKLRNLKDYQKNKSIIDKDASHFENKFLMKCEQEASQLLDEQNDPNLLRDIFDNLWFPFLEEIRPLAIEFNIKNIVQSNIAELYKDTGGSRTEEDQKFVDNIYSKFKFSFQKNSKHLKYDDIILEKCLNHFYNKITQEEYEQCGFSDASLKELVASVDKYIETEFNALSGKNSDFKVTRKDRRNILSQVFNQLFEKMENVQEEYLQSSNLQAYFRKREDDFFKIFKQFSEGSTKLNMLIERFSLKFQDSIEDAVVYALIYSIDLALNKKSQFDSRNKFNLLCEILKESTVEEEETFYRVLQFVIDANTSIHNFIEKHIKEIYEDKGMEFLVVAKNSLLKEIKAVLRELNSLALGTEVITFRDWFDGFYNKLSDKMKLPNHEMSYFYEFKITRIVKFNESISEILNNNIMQLNSDNLENKIEKKIKNLTSDIFKIRIGCAEQCSFCGVICDKTISGHEELHSSVLHNYECIKGFRWHNSKEAVMDSCTHLIQTECNFKLKTDDEWTPYKQYAKYGPPLDKWLINPGREPKLFWQWFIGKYYKEIEDKFTIQFSKIPDSWKSISLEEAMRDLPEPELESLTK